LLTQTINLEQVSNKGDKNLCETLLNELIKTKNIVMFQPFIITKIYCQRIIVETSFLQKQHKTLHFNHQTLRDFV
jgi:hypothetical protein